MELRLSDGIVELLETATVRSSLTAMCPIETSFVSGPRLYSPGKEVTTLLPEMSMIRFT